MFSKKILALTLSLISLISVCLMTGCGNKEDAKVETAKVEEPAPEPVKEIEYDALQKLFIGIKKETTEEQFKQMIAESGLPYAQANFNSEDGGESSYVVAFTQEAAAHKYADSGDHLTVVFSKKTGNLKHAEYSNEKAFRQALFYVYGTHWDLNEKESGKYTGYYSYKAGKNKGGITIEYSNGSTKETGFEPRADAKDAVNDAMTKREK